MAGKRQHYVPRLLQRGFLADPSDEAERTWLHRAGAEARLVSIRDVGVEDWFYSRKTQGSERTLDDAITDFERDLGKDVRALRDASPGSTIAPDQAARTVIHLVMRTAHLRRTIASGVTSATNEIEAMFTNPERLCAMLGLSGPSLASAVVDAIRKSSEDLVPAGFPAALTERLLTFFVREIGDQLVAQAVSTLEPLFPTLFSGLAGKVREMHNTLLKKPLDDHGWAAELSRFIWSVEGATDLILPDAVALACAISGKLEPLLFIRASVRVNGALTEAKALQDAEIAALHAVWLEEYAPDSEFGWNDIQPLLLDSVAPVSVVEVNSRSSGNLAYNDHEEHGLNVIAVGGFSLSRGLTLEGLTVSYFLRNSMMYDTLMQMGRWFGYRPGYDDLCRVWMPEEAEGWYAHIAESIEELRDELRSMEAVGATPEQFGLKVRSHPDTLIVTARNKMGSGEKLVVSIGLANKFAETAILKRDADSLRANRNAAIALAKALETEGLTLRSAQQVTGGWPTVHA